MHHIIDLEQQEEFERSIQQSWNAVGKKLLLIVAVVSLFSLAAIGFCRGDTPTSPASPTCSGQLSLWTPIEHGSQTPTWLGPAARAEGACNLAAGFRVFGRGDLYALPGHDAPTDITLRNVGAGELWGGFSHPVAGPLSLAAFAGIHGAVDNNGVLIGGVSSSFCGGARIDYGADYSVFGVCSSYKPAGNGIAIAGTVVLPVKGVVGVAMNMAWIPKTGQRLVAFGPTASWK